MTDDTSLEELIVALNQYKRRKPDKETIIQVNELQRHLEEKAGTTAVELEDIYQ
jgi:hypothetical protein